MDSTVGLMSLAESHLRYVYIVLLKRWENLIILFCVKGSPAFGTTWVSYTALSSSSANCLNPAPLPMKFCAALS